MSIFHTNLRYLISSGKQVVRPVHDLLNSGTIRHQMAFITNSMIETRMALMTKGIRKVGGSGGAQHHLAGSS